MINRLSDIIKNISGDVLVIDLNDKLINVFESNNNVNLFSITCEKNLLGLKKFKKRLLNKQKNINIKNIKKHINKKSIDYVIINIDNIFQYYKYILRDTIYISRKKIYLYSNKEEIKSILIKVYKRYNVDINILEYKNGYIVEIINNDNKNNFLKNKIFLIKDTFFNIAETIGNFMAG